MKVYISGPMVSVPDLNLPAFRAEAKRLRDLGFKVIDPSENFEGRQNLPRQFYMRANVQHVLNVDVLSVLPGAVKSKGAMLEIAIARELGLPVYVAGLLTNAHVPISSGIVEPSGILWDNDKHDGGILLEANALVHGERQATYKHPKIDFDDTAAYWTRWLRSRGIVSDGKELTAFDVGPMMTLLKLSRESRQHKRDNLVDAAGYLETTAMVLDKEASEG